MGGAALDEATAHLVAYLDLRLETELEAGLTDWQRVFTEAREAWQLSLAGRLLQNLKGYPLTAQQQAVVRSLEGQWLAQQGRWQEALAAYEHSLRLQPDRVAALSGLSLSQGPWAACLQPGLDEKNGCVSEKDAYRNYSLTALWRQIVARDTLNLIRAATRQNSVRVPVRLACLSAMPRST
jgi:tetratricopeptide (TPR) repeat protein